MRSFQIFTKIICLSIILFNFSCSILGQKKQVEKEANQPIDAGETTKETKVKVIWGKNDELSTVDIAQNRDLTLYEQGGYFDCRGWVAKNESKGECDEKKVRDFIWKNWAEKKRAYIRITYDSVDATSTSHIFIEPNEQGEWNVAWRIVRHNDVIDDVLGIVSVEQVKNKPVKGSWALVFKNKAKKILEKMPDFYE